MSTKSKSVLRSRSRSQSRSPSRQQLVRPKPQKTENQQKKDEKKEIFKKEVDLLQKQSRQLLKMTDKYGRVAPNHQLVFTKDGETRILTRQELTAMQNDFHKRLGALNKSYLEGSKNSRAPILPASFKASYTPSRVGPVFTTFLSADGKKLPNFGEIPNDEGTGFLKGTNLLDSLPRAREGYLLKNSLTLLMYIYSTVNDLKSKQKSEGQKNIPDERMNKVFGKQDALYYQAPGEEKVLMTTSGKKMST